LSIELQKMQFIYSLNTLIHYSHTFESRSTLYSSKRKAVAALKIISDTHRNMSSVKVGADSANEFVFTSNITGNRHEFTIGAVKLL